ncbi:hypothetical protein SAMN04487768_1626 [Burkholderia sp. b13]|nr:hypothetical protein SAMN04487768_1626 [Burkholderia sp. b13]
MLRDICAQHQNSPPFQLDLPAATSRAGARRYALAQTFALPYSDGMKEMFRTQANFR